MVSKTQRRRDDLRDLLIDHAEDLIASEGIAAIKARTLATRAGCAVGAIYNVFDELQDIVMAVNGRTFRQLGGTVARALEGHENETPTDRLVLISKAYLGFAIHRTSSWRALFDLRMSTDMAVPDWYIAELELLFGHIGRPLSERFPHMPRAEIGLMTRTLFSSVHGIVLLGLENRISAVPRDQLERMIDILIRRVVADD